MELKITLGVGSNPEEKCMCKLFVFFFLIIVKESNSCFFTIPKSTLIHQTKCSKKPFIEE